MIGAQYLFDRREVERRGIQGDGVSSTVGDLHWDGALNAIAESDDKALARASRHVINDLEGSAVQRMPGIDDGDRFSSSSKSCLDRGSWLVAVSRNPSAP